MRQSMILLITNVLINDSFHTMLQSMILFTQCVNYLSFSLNASIKYYCPSLGQSNIIVKCPSMGQSNIIVKCQSMSKSIIVD